MDLRKLNVRSLAIETTRRCNMQCEHCMRGDAQNKDMSMETLDRLFQRLGNVLEIVPTGGEPSLNPGCLKDITTCLKRYTRANAEGVYLVTNGAAITPEFVMNLLELFLQTEMMDEVCGVTVSEDIYHDGNNQKGKDLLSLLAFYRPYDKTVDWNQTYMLSIGRGAECNSPKKHEAYTDDGLDYACVDNNGNIDLPETTLSLTVDGDLLPYGDYAYEDVPDIKICNVYEPDWFDKLTDAIYEKSEQQLPERIKPAS